MLLSIFLTIIVLKIWKSPFSLHLLWSSTAGNGRGNSSQRSLYCSCPWKEGRHFPHTGISYTGEKE